MFSERLKELREQLNISQTQLANDLNLSRSTISSYELNKRQPDFETLEKLADYFNVSIDYLLGRTKLRTFNENIANNDLKNLLESIKHSNLKTKDTCFDIMDTIFLTLFHPINENDTELLTLLYQMYYSIYKLNSSFKSNTKSNNFSELAIAVNHLIDDSSHFCLEDNLKILSKYRNEMNLAMDELLQYYIRKKESNK